MTLHLGSCILTHASCLLMPLAVGLFLVATEALAQRSDQIDVKNYPKAIQERYRVFAVKCSKCHGLDRPINSEFKRDDWKNYVKKMIRRPGSGINEDSGRQIYEFLKYFSSVKESGLTPKLDGGAL